VIAAMNEVGERKTLCVLVVDDQPAHRLLLVQQLEFLGVQACTSVDGREGLKLWFDGAFDAVIVDCNMPLMDGYALAQALRQQERALDRPPCRLLGYTASVQPEEHARCLQAGMDDCLLKPISLAALQQQLECIWLAQAERRSPLPALALDELHALTGGEPELTRRLLAQVLQSCAEDCQQLLAIAPDDHRAMVDIAHKINGAARIVKAQAVYRACEALEATKAQDDLRPGRQALHLALITLQEQLRRALATLGG
jgi:two-component system sensor histidine kinase EvgS